MSNNLPIQKLENAMNLKNPGDIFGKTLTVKKGNLTVHADIREPQGLAALNNELSKYAEAHERTCPDTKAEVKLEVTPIVIWHIKADGGKQIDS